MSKGKMMQNKSGFGEHKKIRTELAALILAIICLLMWGAAKIRKNMPITQHDRHALQAVLTLGNEERILDLNENAVHDFRSGGIAVHIEVRDHRAAFVHSECKDHICESYGWLSRKGDLAVCLPAQAALSIR